MAEYADPDVLVSTEWVAEHHGDPTVRIVESNEDRALYTQGHVPGAVEIDWQVDLQDQIVRDYVDRKGFEEMTVSLPIRKSGSLWLRGVAKLLIFI